jgi:hypothetical protein
MNQCPSFEYIRTKVSIVAVARALGLNVNGYRARCWRTENHKNGDANPSLAFQKKTNRGMCFVCDQRTWSTIDFVMLYRDCDMRSAVSWITDKFPVPNLPPGSHIAQREAWFPRFHSGVDENVLTMLIRSGIWSELSHAERSILPLLLTFCDRDAGTTEISYRGLMRYSGVGSQATIAQAIRKFQQMHIVQVVKGSGQLLFRGVNKYRLTLDDPQFQSLVMEVYKRQKEEIELERQFREEEKMARRRRRAPV